MSQQLCDLVNRISVPPTYGKWHGFEGETWAFTLSVSIDDGANGTRRQSYGSR